MAKRPGGESSAPPAKRVAVPMAPLDIGPASGEEDLSLKVLQVQNRMLSERLRERNFGREQLEMRLEQMEGRVNSQRRALAAIPRHLAAIKDHLTPLVSNKVTLDLLSSINTVIEGGSPDQVMEEGFGAVMTALREFTTDRGKREVQEEDDQEGVAKEGVALPIVANQAVSELEDEVRALQGRCEEAERALADARFDLEKSSTRTERLERQLGRALEQLQTTPPPLPEEPSPSQPIPPPASTTAVAGDSAASEEVGQLSAELKESQALAEDRLQEIELLNQQIRELKQQLELAKASAGSLSEERVRGSPVYLTLQTQFSVIQQENTQLQSCVEDLKSLLYEARAQHFSQLEEIRVEELKYEAEVQEEMSQLEAALATAKRDHELLRIEFEKRMASNEQAAPIAKELQVTVDSLQKTIQQLKSEVTRYKTRAHKAETKLQEEAAKPKAPPTASDSSEPSPQSAEAQQLLNRVKTLQEEKRGLEEKLEGCRLANQDDRDKAAIITSEKRARGQVEELRKKLEELRRDYEKRKEHLKEEAGRRTKSLTEDNKHLQKELAAKKQETQALVAEMECTAQAFEDMQEQNIRLLQQLKEKDDANFKVISERIKASSMQKLLMEEKDLLQSQLLGLGQEKSRMAEVMGRMEERERGHEATVLAMEKDMALRQQALETLKKKAMDSVQSSQQLQLQVEEEEKVRLQMQESLSRKVEECEHSSQQLRRVQEEVASLKRKLERYKSREWTSSSDEVLLEEIRTYKTKLNCPCCSTRKKDTVLTKCFHVFCSECIRSRYDSRLRKCPKCGAAFGANDFHKLYLS